MFEKRWFLLVNSFPASLFPASLAFFLVAFFFLVTLPVSASPLPGLPERQAVEPTVAMEEQQEEQPAEEAAHKTKTLETRVQETRVQETKGLGSYWRELNFWILQKQREFHRGLAASMEEVSDQSSGSAAWGLILLSFLYGVFHAAGPGHGKAVLTTYLMTQPEKLKRGLLLSFFAALLQGVTAILLVTLLVHLLGGLAREAFSSVVYVEIASFAIIALLGLVLLLGAIKRLIRLNRNPAASRFQPVSSSASFHPVSGPLTLQPLSAPLSGSLQVPAAQVPAAQVPTAARASGEACPSCGKVHHVAPAQVEGKSFVQAAALLLSIGLRPCSGAVLVLVVANLLGLWWIGMTAVMAMALGTSITVMLLAVVAVKTRDLAWRLLGLQGRGAALLALVLAALGGSLLLALGISLMLGAAATEAHPLGIG